MVGEASGKHPLMNWGGALDFPNPRKAGLRHNKGRSSRQRGNNPKTAADHPSRRKRSLKGTTRQDKFGSAERAKTKKGRGRKEPGRKTRLDDHRRKKSQMSKKTSWVTRRSSSKSRDEKKRKRSNSTKKLGTMKKRATHVGEAKKKKKIQMVASP